MLRPIVCHPRACPEDPSCGGFGKSVVDPTRTKLLCWHTVCRVSRNLSPDQIASVVASRGCRSFACCTTAFDVICWRQ